MARSDLRCFRLQRRRWRASCDMRRERRPPCRLMYATVAVLSVRTSTCSPRKRLLRRFKARCTASNSRQLMCQCSWGPVQTPDTACPLNVAPQPLAEASRVNHSVPGDLFKGHSCPKEWKVWPRGEGLAAGWSDLDPQRAALPRPPRDSAMEPVLKRSHMEQPQRRDRRRSPRSLWNCFSGAAVLFLNVFKQFNTDWARSCVRRAILLTDSIPRKEILCTGESLLFSQLTWRPNWLRCESTMSLWSHNWSCDWASISQSSR